QQVAADIIRAEPVAILCGCPGVGKSHTIAEIIKRFTMNGYRQADILLVAPTGKAAKRSRELLDAAIPGHKIRCKTIHAALEPGPNQEDEGIPQADSKVGRGRGIFGFRRSAGNPLDCRLLVCEE